MLYFIYNFFEKNMKAKQRYTTVSIPVQLNEHLKNKIEGTGFHSVSSFVTYVLRQLISSSPKNTKGFSKEDENKVKERLSNLDYL